MFAGILTVLASDADIVVAGKITFQVFKLRLETLLGAEYIESVELDEGCDHGVTAVPAIARCGVATVELTQIVGCHVKFGCRFRLL